MSLFTRNLAKYGQDATLQTRTTRIKNGLPVATFADVAPIRAIIKTVTGVSVFDDTNTERVVTHKLCIAYRSGVTAENWILFGSKRVKILTVENVCEANTQLILMCTERGDDSRVVNEA